MTDTVDPSRVYNPLSTPNMIAGFLSVVGLACLGFAMFSIAKQGRPVTTPPPGATGAPIDVRRNRFSTNTLWMMAYVAVIIILMGFALAWVYD